MARIRLKGFGAIDWRTAAARQAFSFKAELVAALGGEADLSPQRRRLIDMAVRGAAARPHRRLGPRETEKQSVVNGLTVLVQRQALAEHRAKLLDRLGLDRVPQKVKSLEGRATGAADDRFTPGVTTVAQAPRSRGASDRMRPASYSAQRSYASSVPRSIGSSTSPAVPAYSQIVNTFSAAAGALRSTESL